MPPEVLWRTFETNFFSVVALTQALLPLIRKAPAGRIVNVSSILGSLTLHSDLSSCIYDKKAFAYDASKTALNAFTVHLAQELRGTKIKVNSVAFGVIVASLCKMVVLDGRPPPPMDFIFHGIFGLTLLIGAVTRSELYHICLVVFGGALFVLYIILLYARIR